MADSIEYRECRLINPDHLVEIEVDTLLSEGGV